MGTCYLQATGVTSTSVYQDPTQSPIQGGGGAAAPTVDVPGIATIGATGAPDPDVAAGGGTGAGGAVSAITGVSPDLAPMLDQLTLVTQKLTELIGSLREVIASLGSSVAGSGGGAAVGPDGSMPPATDPPMIDGGGAIPGSSEPAGGSCCCCCCCSGSGLTQAATGAGASPSSGHAAADAVAGSGAVAEPVAVETTPPPAGADITPANPAASHPPDSSTSGLQPVALQYLDVAHQYGLGLVSGHRPGAMVQGTNTPSDHGDGHAIDVANSQTPTPEMRAFADAVRNQPGVKYVIFDNQIASATNVDGFAPWEWRPYTHPDYSDSLPESEKRRLGHEDHVHVSFN